jgi:homoserine kinase
MLKAAGYPFGVDISIHKEICPGSGIGSSGASAAGAAYGINQLLDKKHALPELVTYAMEGEKYASGTAHADNVAPALYGGFVLIRSYHPLDIVSIEPPEELFVTVIHPLIEVKTAYSRGIMKQNISLRDAVTQWGNVAGLVAGLLMKDYDLIGRSMVDVIAEPVRAMLIPGFDQLKEAASGAGALGCSISGSGPSVFALSKGKETADKVAEAFLRVYSPLQIDFQIYVSGINPQGARLIQ